MNVEKALYNKVRRFRAENAKLRAEIERLRSQVKWSAEEIWRLYDENARLRVSINLKTACSELENADKLIAKLWVVQTK